MEAYLSQKTHFVKSFFDLLARVCPFLSVKNAQLPRLFLTVFLAQMVFHTN